MTKEFTMSASPREVLNVVDTIQVSKGEVFFPKLTLATKDTEDGIPDYYIIQHNTNGLPLPRYLNDEKGKYDNFMYVKVCFRDFNMIDQAMMAWNIVQHKCCLNPFTFIYTYVLAKYDVDLIETGLFEV